MDPASRAALSGHLRLLREGHRSSSRTVFDLLWPTLTAFAKRFGLTSEDAEDVAQRALLKVFDRVNDYNPALDGLTWVFALTVYEVRTLRRQKVRRRETSMDVPSDVLQEHGNAYDALIAREVWENIEAALGALSSGDREAVLATLDDRGERERLDAAGRKRRQRAIDRLRALVVRLYSE